MAIRSHSLPTLTQFTRFPLLMIFFVFICFSALSTLITATSASQNTHTDPARPPSLHPKPPPTGGIGLRDEPGMESVLLTEQERQQKQLPPDKSPIEFTLSPSAFSNELTAIVGTFSPKESLDPLPCESFYTNIDLIKFDYTPPPLLSFNIKRVHYHQYSNDQPYHNDAYSGIIFRQLRPIPSEPITSFATDPSSFISGALNSMHFTLYFSTAIQLLFAEERGENYGIASVMVRLVGKHGTTEFVQSFPLTLSNLINVVPFYSPATLLRMPQHTSRSLSKSTTAEWSLAVARKGRFHWHWEQVPSFPAAATIKASENHTLLFDFVIAPPYYITPMTEPLNGVFNLGQMEQLYRMSDKKFMSFEEKHALIDTFEPFCVVNSDWIIMVENLIHSGPGEGEGSKRRSSPTTPMINSFRLSIPLKRFNPTLIRTSKPISVTCYQFYVSTDLTYRTTTAPPQPDPDDPMALPDYNPFAVNPAYVVNVQSSYRYYIPTQSIKMNEKKRFLSPSQVQQHSAAAAAAAQSGMTTTTDPLSLSSVDPLPRWTITQYYTATTPSEFLFTASLPQWLQCEASMGLFPDYYRLISCVYHDPSINLFYTSLSIGVHYATVLEKTATTGIPSDDRSPLIVQLDQIIDEGDAIRARFNRLLSSSQQHDNTVYPPETNIMSSSFSSSLSSLPILSSLGLASQSSTTPTTTDSFDDVPLELLHTQGDSDKGLFQQNLQRLQKHFSVMYHRHDSRPKPVSMMLVPAAISPRTPSFFATNVDLVINRTISWDPTKPSLFTIQVPYIDSTFSLILPASFVNPPASVFPAKNLFNIPPSWGLFLPVVPSCDERDVKEDRWFSFLLVANLIEDNFITLGVSVIRPGGKDSLNPPPQPLPAGIEITIGIASRHLVWAIDRKTWLAQTKRNHDGHGDGDEVLNFQTPFECQIQYTIRQSFQQWISIDTFELGWYPNGRTTDVDTLEFFKHPSDPTDSATRHEEPNQQQQQQQPTTTNNNNSTTYKPLSVDHLPEFIPFDALRFKTTLPIPGTFQVRCVKVIAVPNPFTNEAFRIHRDRTHAAAMEVVLDVKVPPFIDSETKEELTLSKRGIFIGLKDDTDLYGLTVRESREIRIPWMLIAAIVFVCSVVSFVVLTMSPPTFCCKQRTNDPQYFEQQALASLDHQEVLDRSLGTKFHHSVQQNLTVDRRAGGGGTHEQSPDRDSSDTSSSSSCSSDHSSSVQNQKDDPTYWNDISSHDSDSDWVKKPPLFDIFNHQSNHRSTAKQYRHSLRHRSESPSLGSFRRLASSTMTATAGRIDSVDASGSGGGGGGATWRPLPTHIGSKLMYNKEEEEEEAVDHADDESSAHDDATSIRRRSKKASLDSNNQTKQLFKRERVYARWD